MTPQGNQPSSGGAATLSRAAWPLGPRAGARKLARGACLFVLGAMIASFAACVDIEPNTEIVSELPSADAGAVSDECRACTKGQSTLSLDCADVYQACEANQVCFEIYECNLVRGCLSLPSEDQINCNIPCGLEAGLTSFDHPAIPLIAAWSACIVPPCTGVCGFSGEQTGD